MGFFYNEKDLDVKESSELIHKNNIGYNNKYDGNEKINLYFENYNIPSDYKISLCECELKELTEDVLKRYMVKAGLEKKDIKEILFIRNGKKLNTNVSIGENGLRN